MWWDIGPRLGSYLGAGGDDAVIAVSGANWLSTTPPVGRVAVWGYDHLWPMTSWGWSAYGVYVGRAGAATQHAEGTVNLVNDVVSY